jgi:hypothetical protein
MGSDQKTTNRDRFRPAIFSHRHLARKRFTNPLAVRLLKIRHLSKVT